MIDANPYNARLDFSMDTLAEEFALMLINDGSVLPDDVIFRSMGQHGRSHRRDIINVRSGNANEGQQHLLLIDLRRDGIYEGLPEALFHEPGSGRSVKRNAAENRNAEHARDFFLPFEQELFRLRMAMRADEAERALAGVGGTFAQELCELWMVPDDLDERTRRALLEVLPRMEQVVGNLDATAASVGHVLGHRVSITLLPPASVEVMEGMVASLGGAELGEQLVAGDRFFDGWPSLLMEAHDLPLAALDTPAERRALRRIMEVMADYFLPAHLSIEYRLNLHSEDEHFSIGDDAKPVILAMNARF